MAKFLKQANCGRCFVFSCFIFLFLLCIMASINEIRFQGLLRFGCCPISNHSSSSSSSSLLANSNNNQELRILIAVLTLPDQYLRRHFLRLVYGTQTPPESTKIDVKFVFCNLTKEDQKVMVALEIMRYDDIIILNCTENMNKGKTSTFFRSLPEIFFNETEAYPPYHYVMKADDDTYVRLNSLVESLKPLPREDLYYGFVIPCGSMDPFKHYMSGMGFLVSWDIVEWIHDSDIPKQHIEGPEDKVFGDWMRSGKKGMNRYNAKWSMYNYPDPPSVCAHDLSPNTIAVHLLKNPEKWVKTLTYFNVTQNLKPSKLYHI